MVYRITCSKCHTKKYMRNDILYRHLAKHKIESLDQFQQSYECSYCRPKKDKKFRPPSKVKWSAGRFKPFRGISEFKKLKKVLQHQVDEHVKRGIHDKDAQINFIENVKSIFDKYFIKSYDYIVSKGDLKGIVIHDVPFLGDYFIKLNTKGEKENERKH